MRLFEIAGQTSDRERAFELINAELEKIEKKGFVINDADPKLTVDGSAIRYVVLVKAIGYVGYDEVYPF